MRKQEQYNRRHPREPLLRRAADVPRLSYFYGIAIYLYYEDHPPPHIHARYGEHQAKVDITTGAIIEGFLPRRAARLVANWVAEHAAELAACWEKATSGEEPGTIDPPQ